MTSPTKFLDNCFFHPIDSRNGGSSNTINSAPQKSVYRQHYNAFCKCSSLSLTRSSAQIEENLLLIDQGTQQTAHVSTNTHVCVCNRIYLSRHFARWQLCKSWFPVFRLRDYASIMALIRPFIKLVSNHPGRRWIHTGQKHGCTIHLSGAICSVYMQAMSFTTWIPIFNALLKTVNTSSYPILIHNPKANNNPIPYLTSLTN